MTEAEWLAATDPSPMLEYLYGKASDRKLRLFAMACLAAVAHLLRDSRSASALTVLADFIDGRASAESLDEAGVHAGDAYSEMLRRRHQTADRWAANAVSMACSLSPRHVAEAPGYCWCAAIEQSPTEDSGEVARQVEDARQVTHLRDIFGNPFRPIAFDPSWRSEVTIALATGIYADRAFDRMPILADALEEAGCEDVDVLTHCCGPGPHVRGCWVVDRVLGKE